MLCAVRLDQRSSPPWISCTPNDNSRLTWRDGTKPPVGTGIGMSTVRMATRVAADSLRRLTEGSQKRATHSVGISKTGFSCNDINWQPSLLNHETRCFQPQILDRLRGCLPRLLTECASELPHAQIRSFSESVHRQRNMQIAFRKDQCRLDSIGLGIEIQQ